MNNKLLSVHEFDTIICNEAYKESRYVYLEEKVFNELMGFAKEFSDSLDFLRIGYKKGVKDTISVNNYVGLIELPSGFQIEILPKIDLSNEDKSKKVFINMLKCLKEFNGKSFSSASLKADTMNMYEIFINMYINEVNVLLKQGLKKTYVINEENLKYYKGKLLVNEHIKKNFSHKENFYVQYDEYNQNRAENKLVKTTLIKLMSKSSNEENIRRIRQILPYFDDIDVSNNYEYDFSKVNIDRNTKSYEQLMIWSKIFLYDKSFTTFSGLTKGKAILFPMEQIFEAYVAKKMKKVLGDEWDISTQDIGYHLFDQPRKFSLRPDIVLRNQDKTIILDTKWKRLKLNDTNFGIAQQDMYQMYAYANKYSKNNNYPEVYVLYPRTVETDSLKHYSFKSNEGITVHIEFVDVEYIEESLEELKEIIR